MQVLPEVTVIYRRVYDKGKVPKQMQQRTSGTTGRCWQVCLEKGWKGVPPDVSRQLSDALARGDLQTEITIGKFTYLFDLQGRTRC